MNRQLVRIVPITILLAMTAFVYREPILNGGMIYGQDIIEQGYPLTEFKRMCLQMGTLPLWNPYMMAGLPQYSSAPFYPTDLLVLITTSAKASTWRFMSHTFLVALFMFLLLRQIGLARTSSLLGACAFGFSGFFVTKLYAGHPGAFNSGIWIPLIFLFLDRVIQRRRLRDAIALGGAFGFQILGEHAQYAYYTILAALVFAAWRLVPMLWRERDMKRVLGTSALGAVSAVMAFSLSSAYLLPMLEITRLSTRIGGTGFNYATSLSLPPFFALSALAPNIWGSPVRHNSVFGSMYWDGAMYIGLIPLLLALFAIVAARGPYVSFFRVIAVFSFLIALGGQTPLYGLIYQFPGFSMMRTPSKILYLYAFAMAVLSGFGLELLRSQAGRMRWFPRVAAAGALLGIVSVVAFAALRPAILALARSTISTEHRNPELALTKLFGLYSTQLETLGLMAFYLAGFATIIWFLNRGMLRRRVACSAIIGLAVIDLLIFSQEQVVTTDPQQHFSFNAEQVQFLQRDRDLFRILPLEESSFVLAQGVLTRLQSVNGYYPVNLSTYSQFEAAVDQESSSVDSVKLWNYTSPLINLLNVKYVLSQETISHPDFEPVFPGEIGIYRNRNVLPRALIVHGSQSVETPEDALLEIQRPDFDPRRLVVLIGQPSSGPSAPQMDGEFARVTLHRPLEIMVDAKLLEPGYLLLSEKDYPAWRAYVNGTRAEILRANYLFRAIRLPPGRHTVEFKYVSAGRQIGEKLSYAALIILAVLLVFTLMQPRLRRDRLRPLPIGEKSIETSPLATDPRPVPD